MSGGGGKVMKGRMSSTIIEEIDEKAMQNLEKQLEQVTIFFKVINNNNNINSLYYGEDITLNLTTTRFSTGESSQMHTALSC